MTVPLSIHLQEAPRPAARPARVVRSLVLGGLLVLVSGLLLYWVARDPSRSLLVPRWHGVQARGSLGAAADWLPSLLHTLAFGLLTAALLPARGAWRLGAIVAWAATNIVFEIGQHPALSPRLAESLLGGPEPGAIARTLAAYFRQGRFDPDDLAAAVGGAVIAAAWLVWLERPRGGRHDI